MGEYSSTLSLTSERPDVLVRTLERMGLFDGEIAVVELRSLKVSGRGTISGYFGNASSLAREAAKLSADPAVQAVYVTLNPVDPECLHKAPNCIRDHAQTGSTTSDRDIECRRLLLVDFDPKRPSGISSTEVEHEAALLQARACRESLRLLEWPEPFLCDSGNGAHLLYQIDLPNDDDAKDLVRQVLLALALQFDSNAVDVDKKVFNAARITKLYGTLTRKGEATPERPHRRSAILEGPERLTVVPVHLLRALASSLPQQSKVQQDSPVRLAASLPLKPGLVLDTRRPTGLSAAIESIQDDRLVLAFFERHGVSDLRPSGADGWYKGKLDHPSHQSGSGKPGFSVHPGKKIWKDLRSEASGGLVKFLEEYHHMNHSDAGAAVANHFKIQGRHEPHGGTERKNLCVQSESLESVKTRIREEIDQELAGIDQRIQEAGEDAGIVASLTKERERLEKKFHDRVAKAALLPRAPKGKLPGLRLARPDHEAPPDEPAGVKAPGRPAIEWDGSRFHEITTETQEHLVEALAEVYERSEGIVEIDRNGVIRQVESVRLRDIIAHYVSFFVATEKKSVSIAVPDLVAKTLVARPSPGFRPLTSVIRTPTLRPDGSILEQPGYDSATGLYYLPDDVSYAPIAQEPTRAKALAALRFLGEPLQDFPFCTDAHRAGALCYLMTCVLRSAIDGVTPGFGFDAPDPGTGKTLFARMGGWIAQGKDPALEAYRHEVEEQEKRATSTLLQGKPIVIWDNIRHRFGSEITDLLITGRYFTGRVLGSSSMPDLLNNTVWCFNGNNLRLNNADSIRRLIWIRMAYPKGDPTKRTDFKIHGLQKWVIARREKLVRACLTVARYGVLNPKPLPPYASFEEWSVLIRQPVVDLLENPEADPLNGFPSEDPDIYEEGAAIAAFYAEWLNIIDHPLTYNAPSKWTICEMLKNDSLRDQIAQLAPGDQDKRAKAFGELLKRWKGRAVLITGESEYRGSWRLVNDGGRIKTGTPYKLVRVE